jgi:hypothetical protein
LGSKTLGSKTLGFKTLGSKTWESCVHRRREAGSAAGGTEGLAD